MLFRSAHAALAPSFADPVFGAQATFRAVMTALAEPGTERTIDGIAEAPAALGPLPAAIAATLVDFDTPIWLDAGLSTPEVEGWLAFHTGAPRVAEPDRAAFAFVSAAERLPDFTAFALGTDLDPSTSTTVVLTVDGFGAGPEFVLAGPGIAGERRVAIAGAPADLVERLAANREIFPRGVDLLLVGPTSVVGLPRTTRIREA